MKTKDVLTASHSLIKDDNARAAVPPLLTFAGSTAGEWQDRGGDAF